MADAPYIFVSGGSDDLRSARTAAEAALRSTGAIPIFHPQSGKDTASFCAPIIEILGQAGGVIHLVGRNYGGEPESRLPGEPRRSFSQLEYDFCMLHKRKVHVIVCDEHFPYDLTLPEEMEKQRLQTVHRRFLQSANRTHHSVGSLGELERCIRKLRQDPAAAGSPRPRTRRILSPLVLTVAALLLMLMGAIALAIRLWPQPSRMPVTARPPAALPSPDPRVKSATPAPAPKSADDSAPALAELPPPAPAPQPPSPAEPPAEPIADQTPITPEIRRDVLQRLAAAPGISREKKDKLSRAIERAGEMQRVVVLPFATGISRLSSADESRALELFRAPAMRKYREDFTVLFVVLGFADIRGGEMRNRALSEARAESIHDLMAGPGKFANVIHPFGMGETQMLDARNLAKNRIAEIWAVRP